MVILESIILLIVFGVHETARSNIVNVALNKQASMSTQYTTRVAGNAVNGIRCPDSSYPDGTTATTMDGEATPWWKVNLNHVFTVRYVIVSSSCKNK